MTRGQFYSSIWREPFTIVGVFNGEGPPVPIPNTEVKLTSVDNTWLATAWEDRAVPTQMRKVGSNPGLSIYSSIAQSVEPAAVNRVVVGSSPTWGAILSFVATP